MVKIGRQKNPTQYRSFSRSRWMANVGGKGLLKSRSARDIRLCLDSISMELVLLAFIVSLFLTHQSYILSKAVFKLFSMSLILDELHVIVESSAYMNSFHSRGRHNGRSLV